jgi:hypothetical protein
MTNTSEKYLLSSNSAAHFSDLVRTNQLDSASNFILRTFIYNFVQLSKVGSSAS